MRNLRLKRIIGSPPAIANYVATACLVAVACAQAVVPARAVHANDSARAELAPLPKVEDQDPAVVELGRRLFFEPRISGDGSISCATCHDPDKGWSDGLELSDGYPGTKYFRRTRSILNTANKRYLYWDGRMTGRDLPTLVRDHISEAHFMQADGRLVLERLRQIPYYERTFSEAMGGEPSYGRILNSIAAFVRTINSRNVPLDKFLAGDPNALSEDARAGMELFTGKAGCIQCHGGPMLSDEKFHSLGVSGNPALFEEPMRHITFRRFMKTLGVATYMRLDHDPGLYALTKQPGDDGKFKTPTLREVSRTAPYMHNGTLATLADVVEFYNRGGAEPAGGEASKLEPLGLDDDEKRQLVAFLESLSGDEVTVKVPEPLQYEERELGVN